MTEPRGIEVLCDDVQLTSPSRDILSSVRRFSKRSTPLTTASPPVKRSARVSHHFEDPDELMEATRNSQLRSRSSWILPIALVLSLAARMSFPIHKLNSDMRAPHTPSYNSLITPNNSMFLMLIPVWATHAATAMAALTPYLRGTNAIEQGISYFLPAIGFLECILMWLMVEGRRPGDLANIALIDLLLSITMLTSQRVYRRKESKQIWQRSARFNSSIRDYWLTELPANVQLCWSFFLLLTFANKAVVADQLLLNPNEPASPSMIEAQMSMAILTLVGVSGVCALLSGLRANGNAIVAAGAAWYIFEIMGRVSSVPDVVAEPHLRWVDPKLHLNVLHRSCFYLGISFSVLLLASCCLQMTKHITGQTSFRMNSHTAATIFGTQRTLAPYSAYDYYAGPNTRYSSAYGKSAHVARKPSEFMMRSLNSDEAATPIKRLVQPNV